MGFYDPQSGALIFCEGYAASLFHPPTMGVLTRLILASPLQALYVPQVGHLETDPDPQLLPADPHIAISFMFGCPPKKLKFSAQYQVFLL